MRDLNSRNGILILYHRPVMRPNAATVMEGIDALARFSAFPVWKVNTELGFPPALRWLQFRIIVLHWTLFFGESQRLGEPFKAYVKHSTGSYKVAFLQDEYEYCQAKFRFIREHGIDAVYTLFEPSAFNQTYARYTAPRAIISHLPGYVSPQLVESAKRFTIPDECRPIDVGYRGRELAYYMGRGAREKHEIGVEFARRAAGLGLTLDIDSTERGRLYGDDWYRFVASSRGMLGVEAGVSIVDVEDRVRPACEALLRERPDAGFEDVFESILRPWENNIYYRTASPRIFEAAAFRVCQILYEGRYSGIVEPLVHYLPLKRDWSNFDEIMRLFCSPQVRRYLTENAYRDLIASGRYSYEGFVRGFDAYLASEGIQPAATHRPNLIAVRLATSFDRPRLQALYWALRAVDYPGKRNLQQVRYRLRRRSSQRPTKRSRTGSSRLDG